MNIFLCLFIPFIGTTLGAFCVFLMKNKINKKLEKVLLGFAAGVMVSASFWSLLIPSIDMAKDILLLLDNIIPHFHLKSTDPEGPKSKFKKTTMMTLAVTLHNIPEGMAVGVIIGAAISGNGLVTLAGAFALAIGIAIQNFPEGAIISMPLKEEGMSKKKAFLYGTLSGVVEPIGAIITILLTSLVVPILPYFLSFAAGAMIYVVIEELIPDAHHGKHSDLATIGFSIGFLIMMILDVALG